MQRQENYKLDSGVIFAHNEKLLRVQYWLHEPLTEELGSLRLCVSNRSSRFYITLSVIISYVDCSVKLAFIKCN